MAQFLTPPASRQSSEAPDAEFERLRVDDSATDLLQSLDTILEKYLHLLDKHQKLQGELASRLSSGFISLAQANYTCPPGRRYGADYYDERMKATRRVALQPPSSLGERDYIAGPRGASQSGASSEQVFSIVSATSSDEEGQPETEDQTERLESKERVAKQEFSDDEEASDSVGSTADSRDSSTSSTTEPEVIAQPKSVKKKPRAPDPIRWYGILVPPSLRSAQISFTEAVKSNLPELASVVVEMQAAEKEISRLRRELERQ